jgi:hypothetical protein
MRCVIRWRKGWWVATLEGSDVPVFMRVSYQRLIDALWEWNVRVVGVERRG